MQVIQIDLDPVGDSQTHVGEALGREAVAGVEVALVPLDALQAGPGVVGDGVEAAAEGDAAGGAGAVGIGQGRVEGGMVVEVFLQVDDVVACGQELGADGAGVGRLVAWDGIVVDDVGEAGDVEGEDGEGAGGLGEGKREGEEDGCECRDVHAGEVLGMCIDGVDS